MHRLGFFYSVPSAFRRLTPSFYHEADGIAQVQFAAHPCNLLQQVVEWIHKEGNKMQFYAYVTDHPGLRVNRKPEFDALDGMTIRDLKTLRGAVNRMRKAYPGRNFKVFTFTNFDDIDTFQLQTVYWA